MKRLSVIAPVIMIIAFTLVPYVRRRPIRRPLSIITVDGSRDRQLHGKARIRARRAA